MTPVSYTHLLAEITSSLSLKNDITVSVTAKPLSQFRQYSEVLPFYKNVLREGINLSLIHI